MPKIIGLGALIVGAILLYFGLQERNSIVSQVSEVFTGAPTDHSMLYLTLGGGLAAIGVGMLVFGKKSV